MYRIENFFFVKDENKDIPYVISPSSTGPAFRLMGDCYDHNQFTDGCYIRTSSVSSIEDGIVTTESGSLYKLGKPHPDYAEYLSAIKSKIPIFTSWSLVGINGNYCIVGIVNGKSARSYISGQDGNFITIESGTRCLVLWRNWVNFDKVFNSFSKNFLDMHFPEDFEISMDCMCRPILFR